VADAPDAFPWSRPGFGADVPRVRSDVERAFAALRDQPLKANDERLRDVLASARLSQHVLQASLELGVPVAVGALADVAFDLGALETGELPIEVELDPPQRLLAFNR
jgi:hypothetical protein